MAARVVNFLLQKLSQLLSEDIKLIAGAEEVFQDLLVQVRRLYDSLDDDDDDVGEIESKDKQLKNLEKDIYSIVYKTEDVIDKFLIQAKLHREKNTIKCFDFGGRNRNQKLSTKINSILERMNQLSSVTGQNQQTLRPNAKRVLTENILRDMPKGDSSEPQDSELEVDEVVGFDEEAKIVLKRLVEGSKDLEIIPVVGMPGLGKSTLVKKIYMDPAITYEFFSTIPVYVGQSYNTKDILLKILAHFTKLTENDQENCEDALVKIISGFIAKGGRCLIVLNDVWVAKVVDSVKHVFPKNNKGHRILMTTRHRYLAVYANPDPHIIKFLTDDESFQLLVKKVFGRASCPDGFVELGRSIAKKCDGVILSVMAIAGALRRCTKKSDWQRIEKNVEQELISRDYSSNILMFVNTSYNQLSEEMKACFLFFGVFPLGYDIPAWKLIRLWIAEGVIKPNKSKVLEETAKNYLNNLVNISLVMVTEKTCDGSIKACRVQGILHNFCKEEASRIWLFQEVCPTSDQAVVTIQDPAASRRLCIQSSVLNDFLSTRPLAEHVRSFYCFSTEQRQTLLHGHLIQLTAKAFPLIRVLDVESINFLLSKDFTRLFHLRYLAISGDFKALPKPFGKFWNLQTLILNTSTSGSTLAIKANIWNMLRLRHLHTNVPVKLPAPPTPKGKASCLQTLSVVTPDSCTKVVFAKACNLRKLNIRGRMVDFLETSNKGGWHNLEELKCLEHLKLINDVLYMSKPLHLPPFSKYLRALRKLTLSRTRFDWSEAERLAELECLEVLKLKENAFEGESWKLAEIRGFSQLQTLWIERADLRIWEASGVHFPCLRLLVLILCDKLEAVPYELADVPSLQEMRLEYTVRAVKSAIEIQRKKRESINFKLSIYRPEMET